VPAVKLAEPVAPMKPVEFETEGTIDVNPFAMEPEAR
jgi:hypothetical protein